MDAESSQFESVPLSAVGVKQWRVNCSLRCQEAPAPTGQTPCADIGGLTVALSPQSLLREVVFPKIRSRDLEDAGDDSFFERQERKENRSANPRKCHLRTKNCISTDIYPLLISFQLQSAEKKLHPTP